MNTKTNPSSAKTDKKLSIYLSTQRLSLLTVHAQSKGLTLTQALYDLIDGLVDSRSDWDQMHADIRRLEAMVSDSWHTTKKLSATITLAIEPGYEATHQVESPSAFDRWLQAVLAGTDSTTLVALVEPGRVEGTRVHLGTRSVKVASCASFNPQAPLILTTDQAGQQLCQAAISGSKEVFALVGQRAEGTHWLFRILASDSAGKLTRQIHIFKHPS